MHMRSARTVENSDQVLHWIKGEPVAWIYNHNKAVAEDEYFDFIPYNSVNKTLDLSQYPLLRSFLRRHLSYTTDQPSLTFVYLHRYAMFRYQMIRPDPHIHLIYRLSRYLDTIVAPVITAAGSAMNLLSFAVHRRKAFHKNSAALVLSALAI